MDEDGLYADVLHFDKEHGQHRQAHQKGHKTQARKKIQLGGKERSSAVFLRDADPHERVAFAIQFHAIVLFLVLVSAAFAAPYFFCPLETVDWTSRNLGVVIVGAVILAVCQLVHNTLLIWCTVEDGSRTRCWDAYVSWSSNCLVATLFMIPYAASLGIVSGYFFTIWVAPGLLVFLAVAAANVLGLLAMTWRLGGHIRGVRAYGVVILCSMFSCAPFIAAAIVEEHHYRTWSNCVGGVLGLLMGFSCAHDTQILFNVAQLAPFCRMSNIELRTNMQLFTAWMSFLGFVNLVPFFFAVTSPRVLLPPEDPDFTPRTRPL